MEVQKAGLVFCLFLFSAAEDCMHCTGEDYRGKISITESGYTCQRWDSQTPHEHIYRPSSLPEKNLEENYCRHTDDEPRPWCYTTDPNIRWDYCSIPRCTTAPPTIVQELTCTTGDGRSYRGTVSVTISGKTCQSWASQTPHTHNRSPRNYPCKGLEENYCRNPDNKKAPWCYTTDPETRWEYCNVPRCEDQTQPDCMHCTGDDYRGKISITESGHTCQRWDSQTPHQHDYVLSILPEKNLEENYCRNPDGRSRPWCYTTDPSKLWEFCSIPRCTTEPPTIVPELTCTTGDGRSYRGTVSVTKSGKTCQRWTSQTTHTHDRTPENCPFQGLEENYCRNPDNKKAPWCHTTDPETRWEYCNVPRCEDQTQPDCMHCTGDDYRGKISITESGHTCQRWDSQTPHQHDYVLSILPEKNLEENYCRNPDGRSRPWCYTTDPSKRWEFCSIPRCTTEPPTIVPELTCTTGDGRSYRGTVSVTKSRKTCQSWASQTPHMHPRTPGNYPCKGLEENYCRNPDNKKAPWCYTTDPETRWEYCNVPRCEDQTQPDCMHCTGDDYRGKISITESGHTCQRWDSQTPHQHDYVLSILPEKNLEENYCRNPAGESRPWCYTTDPSKLWEFCSIPRCTTEPPTIVPELTCTTGDGRSYRGTVSVTKSGKTCQRWASHTPHTHTRTPRNYPCKGLEENYCRNPNNKKAPWCHTTDPETQREYCNVPRCEDQTQPDCMHCTGDDYRGKISITESGHTCQRWDSQTPHQHDYVLSILPEKNLEENYCRNPDGRSRPWCYTTDPSKLWEFCSIPRCTTEPPTIVPELTCTTGDGRSYRGTVSVTKSRKTCQRWASQTPHTHTRTPRNYPCKGLEENYCRNPDNKKAPWCHTTDPETRWEYCNVPRCEDQTQPAADCMHCTGDDYRGKISITESGHTCQRWDSQTPHQHDYSPSILPEKNLEENYCRHTDDEPRPWCYTTDPNIRWDYCSIPRCTTEPPTIVPELTCTTGDGRSYRGTVSVTKSGKTCQQWTSQTTHTHNRTPENCPFQGLEENYCRNPDNKKAPWCYTTDPETRWEYCNVPRCEDQTQPAAEDCMHCTGDDYRGKISITESGHTCQRWDSQTPHQHDYVLSILPEKNLEENYCRNPAGEPRPWCYTTDPSKRWEFCSIPRCTTEPPTIVPELTCMTGDGRSYRGTVSVTKSGKTCQSWTFQTTHTHTRTPGNYPCKGLEENYCRNPDKEKAPWCHTTDPETRWEYCNVPNCRDQPGSLKCGQLAIEPKLCFGQRVVGGCISKPHSWPWQISLRISSIKTHWCGGTLINAQWVLTAAHCLEGTQISKIFLGIHTKRANEPSKQERDVSKIVMGPSGTDIALLKLDRPAVINDKVSPACLPEKDYIVPHGTECFVTGWGKTQGTGGEGYLKETGIPVIENKICNSPLFLDGRVKETEMCAGDIRGGTDSCQGDSGGPLVCKAQNKFVLQGVTSWGIDCANAMKPGVYVRTSKFVDWIEQSMKEN